VELEATDGILPDTFDMLNEWDDARSPMLLMSGHFTMHGGTTRLVILPDTFDILNEWDHDIGVMSVHITTMHTLYQTMRQMINKNTQSIQARSACGVRLKRSERKEKTTYPVGHLQQAECEKLHYSIRVLPVKH
jgi:hypothetical protein